ncbi:MAG: PadR family transcriptional regulator [Actinobacteria bacterium]|nr:PadR family transcriptional regulator [Actinomycetota bacterium]
MSVSYALLGLLEQDPDRGSHGYELKRQYDDYFGRDKSLPYGQVYSTLTRLARDGRVVAKGSEPGEGPERRLYAITGQGQEDFSTWLAAPIAPEAHLQSLLGMKMTLALLLNRPADAYLDAQRRVHIERMRELTNQRRSASFVDQLLIDHALFHLEADLRWIDLTTSRLDRIAKELKR